MGVVYAVTHPSDPTRELALKTVRRDDASADAVARFERESEILSRLQHPNVVTLHACGRYEQGLFLCLDLIPGRDLQDLVEHEGPLEPRRAARLVASLTGAIDAIHGAGILHRDLKPANVMVQPNDTPVLLDFGLARDDRSDRLTQTGTVIGTPVYLAPEQASGQSRTTLTSAVDIYGLGAVLYFALTGRSPVSGASVTEVLEKIVRGDVRPPRAARPEVPAAIEAVCLRALSCDPANRYATPQDLRDDLMRFADGGQTRAGGRRLIVRGLATLVVVALALGGWIGGRAALQAQASPSPSAPSAELACSLEIASPSSATLHSLTEWLLLKGTASGGDSVQVNGDRPRQLKEGAFRVRRKLTPGENRLEIRLLRDKVSVAVAKRVVHYTPTPAWFRRWAPELRPPLPLPPGIAPGEEEGEYLNAKDGSVLVWVPRPGAVRIGRPKTETLSVHGTHEDEILVPLEQGYFLGKYEVSWKQFLQFCAETDREEPLRLINLSVRQDASNPLMHTEHWGQGSDFVPPDNHPVTNLRWVDAAAYAAWAGLRLPSGPEWEYAARGPEGRRFPWGPNFEKEGYLNSGAGDEFPYTAPVQAFPKGASPFGCLNMSGNVSEFTTDSGGPYPRPSGQGKFKGLVDPALLVASDASDERSHRGGSFCDPLEHAFPLWLRRTCGKNVPSYRVGIRVALSHGEAP